MGKRKKSSRKPMQAKKREPLDVAFTCIFCNHDKSVTVRVDKKESVAHLVCRVCDQRFQTRATHLTEPIDIYCEWRDAADAVQKEELPAARTPTASTSRSKAPRAPASMPSDEED